MSAAERRRRLVISKTAAKGIRKLPGHVLEACKNVLRELAAGEAQGRKLKGELRGLRSVRLGRTHRLLYMEAEEVIGVVDIGPGAIFTSGD